MKHLVQMIQEGDINKNERKYREFCGMCSIYNVDPKEVTVCKTSKNNWKICKDDKKIFLVSGNILDDEVIDAYKIKRCE